MELLAELEKFKIRKGDSLGKAVIASVKAIWKKALLKEIQAKLDSYKRILDTRILVRLDARSLQQASNFHTLNQNVQDLAIKLNQGNKTVAQLLPALTQQNQALRDHFDRKFEDLARLETEKTALEQFKESLFFPEILARQEQIQEAHKGTCRWIFDCRRDAVDSQVRYASDDEADNEGEEAAYEDKTDSDNGDYDKPLTYRPWSDFTEWLESDQDVYWINGKVGSGKSTLMEYIRSNQRRTKVRLAHWAGTTDLVIVYYYFWNPGTEIQKNSQGLIRSLLYQILTQRSDLAPLMMENLTGLAISTRTLQRSAQLHAWTERRLLNVMRSFLRNKPLSLSICFFIDGLDEFAGSQDILLDFIRLVIQTPQVKVCVSSRPEQIFCLEFRDSPQLRLQDFNQRDLERTANDKLYPVLTEKFPHQQKEVERLTDLVSKRAQGVFLWLDIVIRDIINGVRNEDTLEELKKRLDTLPDSIDGLFKRMLERLDKAYEQEACQYFFFLTMNEGTREEAPCTLLLLACMESWQHVLQNDKSYFSSKTFSNLCETLKTRIVTRCAGLVELEKRQHHGTIMITLDVDFLSGGPKAGYCTGEEDFWSYWQTVPTFIHRSALDFVRRYFADAFQSAGWRSAASLRYARGVIGVMTILPMLIEPEQSFLRGFNKPVFLGQYVILTMNTLRHLQNYENPEQHEQVFTKQAVQLVEHLYYAASHFEGVIDTIPQHPYSSPAYTTFSKSHHYVLFNNIIGFASFLGNKLYVSHWLASCTYAPEDLNYIFTRAILGMRHLIARGSESYLPYFEIIESLLRLGVNPNLKFNMRSYPTVELQFEQSAWAAFTQVCDELDPSKYRYWTRVLALFLLQGANTNTSILSDAFVSQGKECLIIEESPLSYVERLSVSKGNNGFADTFARLELLQAPKRRRLRLICFEYVLWYKLSETHSERLLKAWDILSHQFVRESFVRALKPVLEEIQAEVTDADKVDPENFVLRSSFE